MFGPLSQLPLPLVLFMHLALGWLALEVYFFLEPLSAQWAGLWAIIAGGAWVIDILNWMRLMLERFQKRDQVEKAILHVSQGAAIMVLVTIAAHSFAGSFVGMLRVLERGSLVEILTFLVPFLFGCLRVCAGIIDVWWFPLRLMPLVMSALRVAAGVLLYRWGMQEFGFRVDRDGQYSLVIIIVPAIWLIVTGAVRSVIVSGILRILPGLVSWSLSAMRRRLGRDKVYGGAIFAEVTATRIRLRK